MTDPDDGSRERDAPSRAFSLLGDSTRLEIVMTLHDAEHSNPFPFTDLYNRVDVDDTGRFNYHLNQLVPRFVRKTGDGYELTAAGERVARAVAAGMYTSSPELGPFSVKGDCYSCGTTALRGEYSDERFRIDCRSCGKQVLNVRVPPSVVRGRSPNEFVEAFERWANGRIEMAQDGLCPDCGGAVTRRTDKPKHESVDVERFAVFDCTVCGRTVVTSFGALALRHPSVESFFDEHDCPLSERPYWTIAEIVADANVNVVSEDPVRVRVSLHVGQEICHVFVDDDLQVTNIEIRSDSSITD